jgi:hypothetical protein
VNSETSSLFFYNLRVERQLYIVNRGYAIVTEQQCLDRTNKFRSTTIPHQCLTALARNASFLAIDLILRFLWSSDCSWFTAFQAAFEMSWSTSIW